MSTVSDLATNDLRDLLAEGMSDALGSPRVRVTENAWGGIDAVAEGDERVVRICPGPTGWAGGCSIQYIDRLDGEVGRVLTVEGRVRARGVAAIAAAGLVM